ncbi:MAG: PRC-barrel domain-containing protein, partial [Acetobacteraceae bacterium]
MASLDDTNDPSGELIGAEQVQGTAVYNPSGERLGSIHDVMIDKRSGRIGYAVLSFGGFLGIGDNYYPLPWEKLSYDVDKGGYVIDLDKATLEGAPSYNDEASADWNDRAWGRRVHDYYGSRP